MDVDSDENVNYNAPKNDLQNSFDGIGWLEYRVDVSYKGIPTHVRKRANDIRKGYAQNNKLNDKERDKTIDEHIKFFIESWAPNAFADTYTGEATTTA
ncbi:MAG: hypothetical protein ACMUJM_16980 [bacterium]